MVATLVQEWLNVPVNPTPGFTQSIAPAGENTATTAGNTLLLRVMVRDSTHPAVTITDNSGTNTWTLVESISEESVHGHLFVCQGAAAVSEVTATWTAAEGQRGVLKLSEWSGVGDLVDSVAEIITPDGGEPAALTPTAADQLVIGAGFMPNTNRTWAISSTNVTTTDLETWSSQQINIFGAYGITTNTSDVAIGWDRTGGSGVLYGVINAIFEEGEAGPTPLSVNAGADQSVYVGQTANVSASAAGGTEPYSYAWTVVSGSGSFLNSNQANTTFTPSGGAGVRVLRCIVTDANSTVAQDDITVTVSQAPEFVTVASVNDATGWTPTGGTVVQVLSDTSDNTLITSIDNPTEQVLDVNTQPIPINTGQHLVARVRARRGGSATTGTVTGHLYVGTTLHATVEGRPVPGSMGDVDITFPASDIQNITPTEWAAGVRFVAEVTATS